MLLIILLITFSFSIDKNYSINLLFTSNWYGSPNDVKSIFQESACPTYVDNYLANNLTFFSPFDNLRAESQRLKSLSIDYSLGESNRLLSFLYPGISSTTPITNIYPTDTQITKTVVTIFNKLYNPAIDKRNILILINRTKDSNNVLINNHENIIQLINQENWAELTFFEYSTLDDLVMTLRKRSIYDIISLLSDPTVNKDMVEKMFLSNMMVWRYRWLIVDLLGGVDLLTNAKLYRIGVYSNNVTILTFARNNQNGQIILLRSAFEVLRLYTCPSSTNSPRYDSGLWDVNIRPPRKLNFLLHLYRNPGPNIRYEGFVTINRLSSDTSPTISIPPTLAYQPFILTLNNSLARIRQRIFRVGFVVFPPFSYKNETGHRVGFMVDLLEELFKFLEVSYEFVEITDTNASGNLDPVTLNYDGLLGKVQRGEVDTISIPFIITVNRLHYFDFKSNLLTGYISAVYQPKLIRGINSLTNYARPFHWSVWVTVLGSCVAITIALVITDHLYPDPTQRYRLFMSLFFSISSLTHGAYFDPPDKRGSRIVMSFWWAFCLLVVIIWASNYTALLAQEKTEQKLNSFFGLLKQKKFRYGTLKDRLVFDFLQKDTDPNAQTMLRIMRDHTDNGTVDSITQAVGLVKSESYVFIYDDRTLLYLAYNNCLTSFGKWKTYEYGVVLAKDSDMTPIMTSGITDMRATGRIRALREQYWPSTNPLCQSNDILDIMTRYLQQLIPNDYQDALDAGYMIGVFIILLAGGFAALLFAGFEKLVRFIIEKRQDKLDKSRIEYTLERLAF